MNAPGRQSSLGELSFCIFDEFSTALICKMRVVVVASFNIHSDDGNKEGVGEGVTPSKSKARSRNAFNLTMAW